MAESIIQQPGKGGKARETEMQTVFQGLPEEDQEWLLMLARAAHKKLQRTKNSIQSKEGVYVPGN